MPASDDDAGAPAGTHPSAPPPFAVGDIVRGKTRSVRGFGVFVRIDGWSRDGLVHRDNVGGEATFGRDDDEESIQHALEYFFPVGSAVWAKVVRMREDERRRGEWLVSLDASVVDQETGIDLDPIGAKMDAKKFVDRRGDRRDGLRFSGDGRDGDRERDGPPVSHPELHKVYKARVARIKAVGVFVDIKGFRRGGLVHRTQISQYLDVPRDTEDEEKEAIISGIVAEGDEVYVKVVDVEKVDGAPPRVSLSMKSVDQGNGEDLDPNNLSYDPPFRGGGRGEQSYRPVGADAGEKVNAGAIKWGHHAGDVKQYGSGGKSYDLLLDDDVDVDLEEGEAQGGGAAGMKFGSSDFVSRLRATGGSPTELRDRTRDDKRRKEKKEKKEKKSKRRKKYSSRKRNRRDYSSDSSSYSRSRSRSPRRRHRDYD